MRFLGYEFRSPIRKRVPENLQPADQYGGSGWVTLWNTAQDESNFPRGIDVSPSTSLTNWTVFACQTLIAGDMGKMTPRLKEMKDGILIDAESAAFSPLLRKPNHFQTWPKFMQSWTLSKQSNGNMYALKERDGRDVVKALYILQPEYIEPLVSDSGDVYYRLKADRLAGVPEGEVVVPASEIIHDRMWCLFHPLVGLSPLFASALAASSTLTVQENQRIFFANKSQPSGILVSAQVIGDDLAKKYKERWETNFSGGNRGRTAVLGNGLEYKPIAQNAVDSELVKQLDMSATMICATHHVPPYKIGVGQMPTYQNAEVLDQIYYDSCIQVQATDAEAVLNEGLGLRPLYEFRFDLDDLIKMDTATQVKTLTDEVKAGYLAPNEARKKRNLPPVKGGEAPLIQQQNWPLDVLADRAPPTDPAAASPAPNETPEPAANEPEVDPEAAADAANEKVAYLTVSKLMELAYA